MEEYFSESIQCVQAEIAQKSSVIEESNYTSSFSLLTRWPFAEVHGNIESQNLTGSGNFFDPILLSQQSRVAPA